MRLGLTILALLLCRLPALSPALGAESVVNCVDLATHAAIRALDPGRFRIEEFEAAKASYAAGLARGEKLDPRTARTVSERLAMTEALADQLAPGALDLAQAAQRGSSRAQNKTARSLEAFAGEKRGLLSRIFARGSEGPDWAKSPPTLENLQKLGEELYYWNLRPGVVEKVTGFAVPREVRSRRIITALAKKGLERGIAELYFPEDAGLKSAWSQWISAHPQLVKNALNVASFAVMLKTQGIFMPILPDLGHGTPLTLSSEALDIAAAGDLEGAVRMEISKVSLTGRAEDIALTGTRALQISTGRVFLAVGAYFLVTHGPDLLRAAIGAYHLGHISKQDLKDFEKRTFNANSNRAESFISYAYGYADDQDIESDHTSAHLPWVEPSLKSGENSPTQEETVREWFELDDAKFAAAIAAWKRRALQRARTQAEKDFLPQAEDELNRLRKIPDDKLRVFN